NVRGDLDRGDEPAGQLSELEFGERRIGRAQLRGVPVDDRDLVFGRTVTLGDPDADAVRPRARPSLEPGGHALAHPCACATEASVELHERLIGSDDADGAHPVVGQQNRHAPTLPASIRAAPPPQVPYHWPKG